jgi:4'-phosphopantetheinyl transferase
MKPQVYFIALTEPDNFSIYEQYIDYVSPEKQNKIRRLRYAEDKKLRLFSDLFVRFLACTQLTLSPTALSFGINDYGKPYLCGFPDFHYNLSHTRNAVAVSLSGAPTGVDAEKIKPVDLKIAQRFFCRTEYDYIAADDKNQYRRFFEIWTKKEAFVKWRGQGLSIHLDSFDVTSAATAGLFTSHEIDGYIVTVCGDEKPELKILKESDLIDAFSALFSLRGFA